MGSRRGVLPGADTGMGVGTFLPLSLHPVSWAAPSGNFHRACRSSLGEFKEASLRTGRIGPLHVVVSRAPGTTL